MNTENDYTYTKSNSNPSKQVVELRPKLGGFLISYILFNLPKFLLSIVWLIVGIFLIVGLSAGIKSASTTKNDAPFNYQSVKSTNKTSDGILIYNLTGPIDTGDSSISFADRRANIYTEIVKKDFEEIKANSNIKNVVFRLNTPGGSIFASEVLGDLINDLVKSKNQKNGVFYFDQVVASGGLYATYKNENNYVIGSDYGETGSIGVIMKLPNFKGLAEKVGYSETVIKSSNSKDIGNPLRDLAEDEKIYLQKQVTTHYDRFVDIVASGRRIPRDRVKSIANGFVYTNQEAKGYGLLDELGDLDKAIDKASVSAGLGKEYNIWEVQNKQNPFTSIFESNSNLNLLGIPKGTADIVDKVSLLKPGTVYAIDDTKI